MAYIEPLVMVYQEYATLSTTTQTAQLPACIIGPCYQIVDADEDEVLAMVNGGYSKDGLDGAAIPNVAAGAKLDADSIRFRFKNPIVSIVSDEDAITPESVEVNKVQCAAGTFPAAVKVGDYIKFDGVEGKWTVYSVNAGEYSFLVNKAVPAVYTEEYYIDLDASQAAEEGVSELSTGDFVSLNGTAWKIESVSAGDGELVTTIFKVVIPGAEEDASEAVVISGSLRTEQVPGGQMAFSVERKVDGFVLEAGDGISVDASDYSFSASGVTAEIDGVPYPVAESELYVGYRALRQDVSSVGVAYTVDEIKANLGKIDPRNPLAYGVNIALANAADTGIYYVGVDSDDLEGYTAAKDKIESYSPLYAIVPLTQQLGVLNMFKTHAEAMSSAEAGQWRIALGNTPLPTKAVVAESNNDASKGDIHLGEIAADGDGDLCWLKDSDATFLSSSCDAGDTLVVTKDGAEYKFTVESVVTDDILTVDQNADFSAIENSPFSAGDKVEYRVEHKLNKEGQAKAIAAASESFGSRRFVHVWPDICIIDGAEQPGYYLCCAVAGAISSLQPHYGMTRLSIAGIDGVKHSGDMFNRSQLNTIAGGGTFIFVQEAPNAAPYIRHQLTTNYGTVEFQEVSFVKNFDYVCYILKDVLQQYIGRWNIVPSTLDAIHTSICSVLSNQMGVSYPMIGSPVLGYSDVRVMQSELSRDRVEAYCNVTFPYPLNTLAVHVISE